MQRDKLAARIISSVEFVYEDFWNGLLCLVFWGIHKQDEVLHQGM